MVALGEKLVVDIYCDEIKAKSGFEALNIYNIPQKKGKLEA